MRRFIFSITILILACNGIVCACPSELAVEDHSSHQMHADSSAENQPDCCDNCDEMTAAKEHGDFALFAHENSNLQDFVAPMHVESLITWDTGPAVHLCITHHRKPASLSTPVMFYDRMLD